MSFFSKKKDTFCALPFSHLSISPDGKQRICCNNNTYPTFGPEKKLINVTDPDFNIRDAFNNPLHREIRTSMMRGEQHPTCFRCWEIENGGGESYRTSFNQMLRKKVESEVLPDMKEDGTIENPRFHYMEMTFGNKCNLRCRMCNPWSSVQWLKEANQLGLWNVDKATLNDLEKFNWFENEGAREFLKSSLEFVDRLNFLGGEPLLIKEHLELLEECVRMGRANKIIIQYNTNLTYIPENIREIWRHFKLVDLNLSCDGFGDVNEYIRYPVKWDKWVENVRTISNWRSNVNLNLSFHCTFQTLNMTRLTDFYDWVWNIGTELNLPRVPFMIYVTQPDYLDPRHAPQHIKEQVTAEHQKYFEKVEKQNLTFVEKMWLSMLKGHLNTFRNATENSSEIWQKFIANTKIIDTSRQQNILTVAPAFSEYFHP